MARRPAAEPAPPRLTVLHDVQAWLPVSEGFVHDLLAHSRHRGVVLTHQRSIDNLDRFPWRPIHRSLPVAWLRASRAQWLATTLHTVAVAIRHRAGIFHVHFGTRAPGAIAVRRRFGIPLVISLHGHDATALARAEPGRYDDIARVADAVIVPSAFLGAIAADLGFPPERVHVLPSGVDTRHFSPTPLPAGDLVVLFVGRLVEKKGIDVLLAAWPEVHRAHPTARLVILGDGPLAPVVDEAATAPGVTHVLPDPRRSRDQVRDLIRAATVVTTPSRRAADGDVESLLVVNLEAQASARPVVTTDSGGIPEHVAHGTTALVVPEGDATALAEAIARILGSPALAQSMADAGPRWADRYDLARTSAAVDELYDSLAAVAPWWARRRLGR